MSLPFTDDWLSPYDNPTVRLLWGRMEVERGVSLMHYLSHSATARMIYKLKYGGCPDIGVGLGRLMAGIWQKYGIFDGIDMIVPMPLHKSRERRRGYNQCLMIAQGLSEVAHVPVRADVVQRGRNTTSQATLSMHQRMDNLESAFIMPRPALVEGKHVMLVDDIITTGSTLAACGRELNRADGMKLSVATIGRAGEV